jgi:hypothetical protein
MPFQAIKWRELKDLARQAGFSWGGDAGMELCTQSLDGESELAGLVQLVETRTRKHIADEAAGKFDPNAVFQRHRVGTFPEQAAAAREIYAIGHAAGVQSCTIATNETTGAQQ